MTNQDERVSTSKLIAAARALDRFDAAQRHWDAAFSRLTPAEMDTLEDWVRRKAGHVEPTPTPRRRWLPLRRAVR